MNQTSAPGRPTWAGPLLWISLAAIAVGVLGLLAAGADWAARTYEMNQLVTRIEASEAQMGVAQEAIGSVEMDADSTPGQKADAEDDLREASAAGGAEVAGAGREVAALTFLPWHREQIAAQGAYLAHNRAWVDYLERGAVDPVTLFGDDNQIEPTWVQAETSVRDAVPIPSWPPLTQRVDVIFRDEEPPPADGIPA